MDRNGEILWELKHVSKYFSGVQALDDVSVQFRKGEIHALVGENGSGKSTLIKCLSGVHQPEEGILFHNGKQINISNPIVARKHGVATIFQEFSLVPTLSVAENIFLGRLPAKNNGKGIISWDIMSTQAREILNKLDIDIDPGVIVNKLSVAQQQLVEIAKALSMDATLLIMDEPTTALGLSEIERLHQLTRRLRDEGYSIIYISHRLDELVNLVDFVTVLKDGKVTGECKKEDINVNEIVRIMIGSDIANHYPKQCNVQNEVLFRADGLETGEGVHDVTLDVKRGEVLGLVGLIGSGRTEIARAIFGADQLMKGSIEMSGKRISIEKPTQAIKNGIAFITENRKTDGLFMNFFAGENITIVKLKRIMDFFFLNLKKEEKAGYEYIDKLKITSTALEKSVKFLSGGNQQKVVIARWIFSEAELFIMDEPTQGIDIKAKIEVYQLINQLTANGKAVILISSDFPELMAMSDRLAIVQNKSISAIVNSQDINREELMRITLGNKKY